MQLAFMADRLDSWPMGMDKPTSADAEGSAAESPKPSEGSDEVAGRFMLSLPIILPADLMATSVTFTLLPWGAPAFHGTIGTAQDDACTPALVVTFEWPISWLRVAEPIPKFDRESLYLRRYSTDQALAQGVHAFSTIQRGADPPDARVVTNRGELGVESTVLALQERRGVHGLFQELRHQLLLQDPTVFNNLVGHAVYVWFEDLGTPGLAKPHRRSDGEAIQELVEGLAAYEPNSQQPWVPSGPAPEKAPPIPLATTEAGARFYAFPFMGSEPTSILFTVAGFDIGIVYTTFLTAQAAWG